MFTCTILNKQLLHWAYVHFQSALLNAALRGCVETCQAQHLSHQEDCNHSNHTYPQHLTSKCVEILNILNIILNKPCCGETYTHLAFLQPEQWWLNILLYYLSHADLYASQWRLLLTHLLFYNSTSSCIKTTLFHLLFPHSVFLQAVESGQSHLFVLVTIRPLPNMIRASFYIFNEDIQNSELATFQQETPWDDFVSLFNVKSNIPREADMWINTLCFSVV